LLVLPTLGTASSVAQKGYPGRAVSALVGTVLLNLCLLLPIVIFLWYPATHGWQLNFKDAANQWNSANAIPYDMTTWRIETVLLVVLGFALGPISMGRWALGRIESSVLILGYAAYIVLLAVFAFQME
jgi:Ca2+/Na+ antiporter